MVEQTVEQRVVASGYCFKDVYRTGEDALMDALHNQVIYCEASGAPITARIVAALAECLAKPDGNLFLALGERYIRKEDAQKLDNHLGKVVQVTKEGAAAAGNPFVGRAGALPEIWSFGHRNPQGAAIAPDGSLWINEHGPQGGDEINVPRAGGNYGWPVITFGESYGGGAIGDGITRREGMEQPLHYWVPSIAPSGMAFLTSDRYGPAMKGNLFVGSLKFAYLARIELAGGKVVREHKLIGQQGERVRDVRQGPDGLLYVLTDSRNGKLLRLLPPR